MAKLTKKIKAYGQRYRNDLKAAYRLGYNQGFRDSSRIPRRPGTKTAAAVGYGRGISEYRKQH